MAGDQPDMLSVGMQLSVLCSEDAPGIVEGDIERETAGTLFGRHLIDGQLRACAVWPKGAVDPDYHAPVVSDVPALVLSGAIDPVTPPSWGEAVVRHLSRGRHMVAAATGHGVAGTPCGAGIIAEFIDRADAAGLDASCLERPARPPFFLTPAGPVTAPARAAASR
jgi:pimeloyl-ACP methyl ester carboxylesterase